MTAAISPRRLALAVTTRDEALGIGQLLDGLRPWVDDMPVVRIGSRDDIVQLAQPCRLLAVHRWP